ncbi:MAG: trypsin-like serine protease [Myxococcota bacterium]
MAFGCIPPLAIAATLLPSTPRPDAIVNGEDALPCQWPSTVALEKFGSLYCTGTLIHPQVILTAAHCLHPDGGWGVPDSVNFGEDALAPELTAEIETCGIHPLYVSDAELHSPQDAYDLAYCLLDAPVDVPPTPVIMGCEVEQLVEGRELTIVGFGASGYPAAGPEGAGSKRWSTQTLQAIDGQDQVFVVGDGSACSGDSGGPAYVQLVDGSWRVLGATARAHPDTPDDPPYCLYGTVYTGAWNEMLWYEQETDLDVTPCYDPAGRFDPDATCGLFPLDPLADATWEDACAGQPIGDAYAECPDPPADDTGAEETTVGLDDTAGSETDSTTTAAIGTSTGAEQGTAQPGSTVTGFAEDSGSDGTGTRPSAVDDDGGCACHTHGSGTTAPFVLVFFAAVRRRRAASPPTG